MKSIQRDKHFEKHFKQRIARDKKLSTQFKERLTLFCLGVRDYPLHDHALIGSLAGKRSFSVAADMRVVYKETDDAIIFVDVGTHNQVYGK